VAQRFTAAITTAFPTSFSRRGRDHRQPVPQVRARSVRDNLGVARGSDLDPPYFSASAAQTEGAPGLAFETWDSTVASGPGSDAARARALIRLNLLFWRATVRLFLGGANGSLLGRLLWGGAAVHRCDHSSVSSRATRSSLT
jgi:hypothetical protein